MTQEKKQLLLLDLCGRLPHGVKVRIKSKPRKVIGIYDEYVVVKGITDGKASWDNYGIEEYNIKPYLRPMSSMTDEETEEYRNLSDEVIGTYGPYNREFKCHCVRLGIKPDNPHECIDDYLNMEAIDWLNAHHFDYRGLIEKGLAIEAPEGMYGENC